MSKERFCVNNLQLKEMYIMTGQRQKPNINLFDWIERNGFWMPKEQAESSIEFRHVASYAILYNSQKQILTYRRKNSESRLDDQWSIGVGGHLSEKDTDGISIDFIGGNVIREIFEETNMDEFSKQDQLVLFTNMRFNSFIISDETPTDAAHVGHAWTCLVPEEAKMIGECSEWRWFDIEQIMAMSHDLESWSKIMVKRLTENQNIKRILKWHGEKSSISTSTENRLENSARRVEPVYYCYCESCGHKDTCAVGDNCEECGGNMEPDQVD